MNEEVIIKVDVTGDGSVDKLNKKLDQTGEYSEKATSEIGRLRRELRDAKSDMLKYAEGTEQYNKALRRAAEIQGRVKETNDIVRAGVRDLGATTKLVAGTIGGLASGFQVAQGAMALFGVENDAVLETMMKMQALMSVTSGIAGFANGFDDLQDLLVGFRAEAGKSTDAVNELSKVSGEAADNMSNIAKEGAVIGSNLAGAGIVANESSKSMDKLTKASKSYIDSIRDNQELKDLRKQYMALYSVQKHLIKGSDEYIKYSNAMEDIENKMSDVVENETDKIKESLTVTDKSTEAKEKSTKTTEKATNSLGKQILTMGAWIVVIGIATYAISKLVEWMNYIPEDVKIKIELDTEFIGKIKSNIDKVRQFALDYNKASRDGNKERMTELEKYAKKEFDVNAEKLKAIKNNVNAWRDAFKEYLQIAKDTYYNEALSKKKAEVEVSREIAKVNMETYTKQLYKQYGKKVTEQIIAGEVPVLTGVGAKYRESVEQFNKANEDVLKLNSVKFRNVDLKTGVEKPSGGNKSKYSPPSLKDTPEVVTAEKVAREQIKWEEFKNAEKTRLQEEQQSISQEIANRKIPITGGELNVFQELNFDVRLLKASLEDMNKEYSTLAKRKSELEGYKSLFEEESKNVTTIYDTIDKTNEALATKETELNALLIKEKELQEVYSKSKNAGEAKKNKEAIDSIRELINSKKDQIETDKNHLKILEKGLADAKERQSKYKEGSNEYIQISQEMLNLDIEIDAQREALHDKEVNRWREKINMAKEYVDAIGNLFGGFADIAQGNMDVTNAFYDQKIWDNEEIIQSDKDRADNEYKIQMERWEMLKQDFENQKQWKEAQAWMDFASGSVGIWTGVNSKLGVPGIILAGIQQAALLATTIGNVKSIQAQQMLKPHKPGGNSSGGSSSANIALNPAKDALTSRDENLNTMSKSNIKDIPQQKVLVSDINDVQAKVKTREENSSF